MKDLFATRMTLSLRSHFFYKTGGEDELRQMKNPLDILIALRHHYFGLQKPTESYVKGEKFYDFVALYEWICEWRGFDLHPEWAARELLSRVIRDILLRLL